MLLFRYNKKEWDMYLHIHARKKTVLPSGFESQALAPTWDGWRVGHSVRDWFWYNTYKSWVPDTCFTTYWDLERLNSFDDNWYQNIVTKDSSNDAVVVDAKLLSKFSPVLICFLYQYIIRFDLNLPHEIPLQGSLFSITDNTLAYLPLYRAITHSIQSQHIILDIVINSADTWQWRLLVCPIRIRI